MAVPHWTCRLFWMDCRRVFLDGECVPVGDITYESVADMGFLPALDGRAMLEVLEAAPRLAGKTIALRENGFWEATAEVVEEVPYRPDGRGPRLCTLRWLAVQDVREKADEPLVVGA